MIVAIRFFATGSSQIDVRKNQYVSVSQAQLAE